MLKRNKIIVDPELAAINWGLYLNGKRIAKTFGIKILKCVLGDTFA
jgi:hypothetical protein